MEFSETELSQLQPEKYFAARGYIRLDTTKEWENVKTIEQHLNATKTNIDKTERS